MPIRLIAPRHWPLWLGLGLFRLGALLPFGLLLAMGRGLGSLLLHVPAPFIRTARRNIELCLPQLSAAERAALLKQHLQSIGIALFETALAWWAPQKRVQRLMRIEGREHLETALARGRGVILLGAHFTTLEISGRALGSVQRTNFLYRPTRNPVLAWLLARNRCRWGGHAIPRDDIRGLISALKKNEVVWYAPDQSYRKKGAQMVELFGIPAATNTLTSRLARMTGATVLPYFFERLPGAQGYRAVIHPPLENFPSECAIADTERFNRIIETEIRRMPEQYLWVHRRFKGLSDDYPDYYGPAARVSGTTATSSTHM